MFCCTNMDSTKNQTVAIVEFDYTAVEPDELSIRKGDVVHSIKIQPGGWWEGSIGGKTGMFPDNFVRLIPADSPLESPVLLREKPGRRKCKVVYSYDPNNEDELALSVGDVIDILGEVEEGWWRGKHSNRVGVFPSNFVVPIEASPVSASRKRSKSIESKTSVVHSTNNSSREDLTQADAPLLPPKPAREFCQALFAYDAANEDELSLVEGDIITLLSRDVQDKGWWKGELRGRTGVFPDNFVQIIAMDTSPYKDSSMVKLERSPASTKNLVKSPGPVPAQNPLRKDSFNSRYSPSSLTSPSSSNTVAAQRKSLEMKSDSEDKKNAPPLPGKKPSVPIKKSPIANLTGGLIAGLKQKVKEVEQRLSSDSTDGGSSSRLSSQISITADDKSITGVSHRSDDNEFDHVERTALLQDPRALRPKAPGRRPPSQLIKELETGIMNGNAEHMVDTTAPVKEEEEEEDDELVKPKSREWEKHKAPWMEELKLNQAKKVSPSDANKAQPAMDRAVSADLNMKRVNDIKKENLNPLEMSKSMTAISTRIKVESGITQEQTVKKETTTEMSQSMTSISSKMIASETNLSKINEMESKKSNVALRNRSLSPISHSLSTSPIRPVTISETPKSGLSDFKTEKISPVILRSNLTNLNRPSSVHIVPDNKIGDSPSAVDLSVYNELKDRIAKLEKIIEHQNQTFTLAIQELTDKLAKERDIRLQVQVELEKLAQCVTQV